MPLAGPSPRRNAGEVHAELCQTGSDAELPTAEALTRFIQRRGIRAIEPRGRRFRCRFLACGLSSGLQMCFLHIWMFWLITVAANVSLTSLQLHGTARDPFPHRSLSRAIEVWCLEPQTF
jgi:hypothetical protein